MRYRLLSLGSGPFAKSPYNADMKRVCLGLIVAVAANANASFDLMLLGDNTTPGQQRVMRYDPVNRVELGSFGAGFLNDDVVDIAVDKASGRAFVLTSFGSVRAFNYNTGEFLDGFSAGASFDAISFDSSQNRLTFGNGVGGGTSPGFIYDATTFAPLPSLAGRFISTAPLRRAGTNWYASFAYMSDSITLGAVRHSIAGGPPLGSDVVGPAWANFNAPRHAIFTSDQRLMGISSNANANSVNLWTIGTDVNGYTTGVNVGTSLGVDNSNVHIVNGHGNLAYILMGSTITAYHTGMNSTLGSQTLSFSSNIRGMAIVLAPEPGTLMAFAFGGFAWIRKRRIVKG